VRVESGGHNRAQTGPGSWESPAFLLDFPGRWIDSRDMAFPERPTKISLEEMASLYARTFLTHDHCQTQSTLQICLLAQRLLLERARSSRSRSAKPAAFQMIDRIHNNRQDAEKYAALYDTTNAEMVTEWPGFAESGLIPPG